MDVLANKQQVEKALKQVEEIIDGTDWDILFPNTNDTVVYIEAKAKLIDAKNKLKKINENIASAIDTVQS